jgi:hypothetical protein
MENINKSYGLLSLQERAEKHLEYQRQYQRKRRANMSSEQRENERKDRQRKYLESKSQGDILERKRQYQKLYRLNGLTVRLRIRNSIATNINTRLRRFQTQNKNSSLSCLGCDMQWLEAWLEIQFQSGMTWDNWGKTGWDGWEIDHIRPCASFDLSDLEQQKQCFHWTNLQPLWSAENRSKSGKC